MKPSLLCVVLALGYLLFPGARAGPASGLGAPPPVEIPATEEAPPGGDFTLQSSTGPVSLADFRGKAVLLYFGYSKCPDICPTSLAYIAQVLSSLSAEESKQVQAIFVSVDPKRDTPAALAEYAHYFHPDIVGVTGSEQEIASVSELYGAKHYEVALEGSAFGYAVNHSAAIYLIAPDGALRFVFPREVPPAVILEAVRYLLSGQ